MPRFMMLFSTLVLSLSFLSTTYGAAIPVFRPTKRATICNGREELCSRSYGNVTFVGAHNSYAASKDIIDLGRNQEVDVTTQLALGVRLLQGQAHDKDGELHFCHTDCALFDGGKVEDYLKKVKEFLDVNPNEVVTLIVTNPDGQSVTDVWKPAFDNSGLTPFAFVPPQLPMKQTDWPSLGQLIESGKRVVVFMDFKADPVAVNFILPQFDMIWETPFSVTDATFPCKVDRVSGPLSNEEHMYMINHSLNRNILPIGDGVIVPDFIEAETTNSVSSIMNHAAGCAAFGGNRAPNFVLLDWIGKGEPFKAADQLNGFA